MSTSAKAVRVVGAGPAGLMAAETLAKAGLAVSIIDHHASPARKFLLAGRGGLNLTHSEPLDRFLDRYGPARIWLEPALRAFPPEALRAWCADLGIETFVGSSGRIFPRGLKASPLLRAWLRRLAEWGVTLENRTPWTGFDSTPTILALGGASWPELGSDGSWTRHFEAAGIPVAKLRPFNVRQLVNWNAGFATKHAGTPIKNVAVTIGQEMARGEIMIAADGIEGAAIYALSRQLHAPSILGVDLKPDLSEEAVRQRLARPRGKSSRSTFLRKALNLAPAAIALMAETRNDDPKNVRIETQGPHGLRRAISTSGGVPFTEVDAGFRLLKAPSTWVAGEMLDWDAPTGGYLLQACFATARWAAEACLKQLREK